VTVRNIRYQAAVVENGCVLLLYCVPHGGAGFWVLPGGGREEHDSTEACVMREVREEAGIDVTVERLLYDIAADPPDGTYQRWRTYLCRHTSGVAAPGGGEGWAELTAIRWLPLHDSGQWASALDGDTFLHAQLLRIRG
jgi:8-oxo-dGTP pyrophosphatase MutT (NUDIX family)